MGIEYVCAAPGSKSRKIIERDYGVISHSLTREYDFVYKKARGCYVWDVEGKKYLDFASGVAVCGVGHSNPEVVRAIKKQLDCGIHVGFSDFYAELPVEFAELLITFLPHKELNQVFLSSSGTESVEAAYKLARWHANKKWCIAFRPSFHGRTMGSLSLTNSKPVHKERFDPFLPVKHAPYPYCWNMNMEEQECSDYCLSELEKTIKSVKGELAAIFFEPIAGEPGYIVPPEDFVRGLRKLCDEYDALLAVDEVQSGCYRTGKFLAIENFKVEPDIVAMSKAIGGGLPLGATISTRKIMDWAPRVHANTFGGNLLACAAGIATLNYMRKNKLGENARKVGSYMLKRLREMQEKYEIVGEVRGIGLMLGVELTKDRSSRTPAVEKRSELLCSAISRGLILLPAGESAVRIAPPLVITKEQAERGLDVIESALKKIG